MKFYREWLPLEKKQFRIMAMLSDKGKFEGTLSDICRYFLVDPQNKTRQSIRASIEELQNKGFIDMALKGRTLTIKAIPKAEEIEINKEWYDAIRLRKPSERSVSWEAILKVLLWVSKNDYDDVVTNEIISEDLELSPSVICSAKNVLEDEFGAIKRAKVSERIGEDRFRTIGQHISGSAFWDYN